jgi:site-specific DNA recombinase
VEALDTLVWEDACRLLRDPSKVEAEYRRREGARESKTCSVRAEQVAGQIKRVKKTISRLIDAYGEGLVEKGEFEPRVTAARERLVRLEAEASELADEEAAMQGLRLVLGRLEEFAERVREGLESADWHARREILRALIKRVEVGKDEVKIVYRVSPPPFAESPEGGILQHWLSFLES